MNNKKFILFYYRYKLPMILISKMIEDNDNDLERVKMTKNRLAWWKKFSRLNLTTRYTIYHLAHSSPRNMFVTAIYKQNKK